jgi:ubiquinone/menaquinone biosynthesis C-methylase UbiE
MKNPFKSFFARRYDAIVRKTRMGDYRMAAKEIAQRISGGRILDVGAGPSYVDIELAKLGDFEIVTLDDSKEMLGIAERNIKKAGVSGKIKVKLGSAEDLPFDDSIFDFVISIGSLHSWKAPLKVFEEIYRVLKNGGGGMIGDLCREAPEEEIAKITDKMSSVFARRGFRNTVKQSYTQQQVEKMLSWTKFRYEIENPGANLIIWLKKAVVL